VKVADLLDLVYEALEDWPGGYKGEYVHTREGYLMGLDAIPGRVRVRLNAGRTLSSNVPLTGQIWWIADNNRAETELGKVTGFCVPRTPSITWTSDQLHMCQKNGPSVVSLKGWEDDPLDMARQGLLPDSYMPSAEPQPDSYTTPAVATQPPSPPGFLQEPMSSGNPGGLRPWKGPCSVVWRGTNSRPVPAIQD
jgi:hypothetical protein